MSIDRGMDKENVVHVYNGIWAIEKNEIVPITSNVDGPAAAAAKSLQSCPTVCDPIDGRPPGSPVPGVLQARTLEWVAISFSSAWKWKWSRSVVSDSSRFHGLQPTRLLHPWDFPGKSTGVGCHRLFHCMFIHTYIFKHIRASLVAQLVKTMHL